MITDLQQYAANDELILLKRCTDPSTQALLCAARIGAQCFRVLIAPGSPLMIGKDQNGVMQFARFLRPTG